MNRTTEITCPGCGTISHFDQLRRSADEFCRRCDYPLFWVRSSDEPIPVGEGGDVGLRRLPGAGGHQAVATLGCPHCNEPNLHTAKVCIRCGGDMRPAPPPEPVPVVVPPLPEPEPEPLPPPPEPEPVDNTVLLMLLLSAGLLALIALIAVLL